MRGCSAGGRGPDGGNSPAQSFFPLESFRNHGKVTDYDGVVLFNLRLQVKRHLQAKGG
jgi:hypothetical protein